MPSNTRLISPARRQVLRSLTLPAENAAGDDPEKEDQPDGATQQRLPGPFPGEVRNKEDRRDFTRDRQGQDDPRERIAALAKGEERRDDKEKNEQVDVAVDQVAHDWPQAQDDDGHFSPRRERPLRTLD